MGASTEKDERQSATYGEALAGVKLEICPKCGAEDSMEHIKTKYHGIETHYDVCVVCNHNTDPE